MTNQKTTTNAIDINLGALIRRLHVCFALLCKYRDARLKKDAVKFDLRAIESLPGQISWRLRENIGPMNTATRTAKPALDGLHLSSVG